MKKIVFIFTLLSILVNSIHAMSVKFEKSRSPFRGAKMMIHLKFDTKNIDEHTGKYNTNWVAIYKKGTSNDWKNVISWAWVKDIQVGIAPGDTNENRYFFYDIPEQDGDYEFRFFLNNSYKTFASFEFSSNKASDHPILSIKKQTEDKIIFNSTHLGKTWIGIYQRNKYQNDWKYVRAWSWVDSKSTTINLVDLDRGNYTAKLFYNNSYKEEKSINFSHNGINQDNFITINYFDGYRRINVKSSFQVGDKKSWIGIFKEKASNSIENRIKWQIVKKEFSTFYLDNLEVGNYELRLFYDNENNVVSKTKLKIDGKQIFTLKKISYNQHQIYNMYQSLTYFAPIRQNDWVGLFEKGVEKTRANLISWERPKSVDGRNEIIFKTPGRAGTFELVYFKNDSYEQLGNSLFITFN